MKSSVFHIRMIGLYDHKLKYCLAFFQSLSFNLISKQNPWSFNKHKNICRLITWISSSSSIPSLMLSHPLGSRMYLHSQSQSSFVSLVHQTNWDPIQGTPQDMQVNPHYDDVVREVREFFTERIARLNALGFNNIILDQGFGFGKTVAHNYELMDKMDSFLDLGYPLLVGISRKSMIWRLLEITPQEALNGTTVLNTISLLKGAHILRVHDVREAVETVKIVETMKMSL